MFFALSCALLSAAPAPDYSVIVSRHVGVEPERAAAIAGHLARALEREPRQPLGALMPVADASAALEKAGFPDPAVCSGAAACVANLGKLAGLRWVVSLQLAKVGTQLTADAAVLEAGSGRSLAVVTRGFSVDELKPGAAALASDLLDRLPTALADDAPRRADLEPGVVHVDATPPLSRRGPTVALGLGAVAVVVLALAVGFGVSALNQSNGLSVKSPTYANDVSNVHRNAAIADGGYVGAAALGAAAVLVWRLSD